MNNDSNDTGSGNHLFRQVAGWTALLTAAALFCLLAFGAVLGITGLVKTVWRALLGG